MIKTILQKEDNEETLRKVSTPLSHEEIFSDKITNLKADLVDTLRAQKLGVGISAVQIGEAVRLFAIEIKKTPARPDIEPLGPLFFFNPEIISSSEESVDMFEACLSIKAADLYGDVKRPVSITVKFLDEFALEKTQEFSGFIARVIQHEIDHLNGKLFTDIAKPESLVSAEDYKKSRAK